MAGDTLGCQVTLLTAGQLLALPCGHGTLLVPAGHRAGSSSCGSPAARSAEIPARLGSLPRL